jgi:two-component system chemotaxis response regulator CheB
MLNAQIPRSTPALPIRVLVVDDSVVMRRLLSDALRGDPEIEVVGTASNGAIALQRVPQLCPDVVTLDIEMPEMDGLATLRELKRRFPCTRVIMCSSLTEKGAGITVEALALGADDYLTKISRPSEGEESFQCQLTPKIKQFFREHRIAAAVTPAAAAGSTPAPRRPYVQPKAVAIGVSTGGPNALSTVIPMLPKAFPLPVFIVQHMPPMFTRLLAERLQTHSNLPVFEARDGMTVEPGTVYIAPGDFHLSVARRGADVVLHTNQDPAENSCRPAVDVLFRSVGQVYGAATISVILTGMGQDGLRGVEQLRSLGGYVIAQDEPSSVVWGMPGFVVRAGYADSVCDLNSVAPAIIRRL